MRSVLLASIAGTLLCLLSGDALAQAQTLFVALDPCRVVDTRVAGSQGAGVLFTGVDRHFTVKGAVKVGTTVTCGVPSSATAVAVTLTAIGPNTHGDLQLYQYQNGPQWTSNVNFRPNQNASSGFVTAIGSSSPDLSIYCNGWPLNGNPATPGSVHVTIDVTGYFLPRS